MFSQDSEYASAIYLQTQERYCEETIWCSIFLACLISLLSISLFYRITKLNIGAFAGTNIVILNKSNSSWTSFFNYDRLHYHPNPICSTLNPKLYL